MQTAGGLSARAEFASGDGRKRCAGEGNCAEEVQEKDEPQLNGGGASGCLAARDSGQRWGRGRLPWWEIGGTAISCQQWTHHVRLSARGNRVRGDGFGRTAVVRFISTLRGGGAREGASRCAWVAMGWSGRDLDFDVCIRVSPTLPDPRARRGWAAVERREAAEHPG